MRETTTVLGKLMRYPKVIVDIDGNDKPPSVSMHHDLPTRRIVHLQSLKEPYIYRHAVMLQRGNHTLIRSLR